MDACRPGRIQPPGGKSDLIAYILVAGIAIAGRAELHPDTRVGNALDHATAGIAPESVDAIATSPTYPYRAFHVVAYREAVRVLKTGAGWWSISWTTIRGGEAQGVHLWHRSTLITIGLEYVTGEAVAARRMGHGKNRASRVAEEWVLVFDKPES